MTGNTCRFCAAPLEQVFADLGVSPLANSYITPERRPEMEPFFPLCARVCSRCFLVQLEEHGGTPDRIFSDYAYFSSYSTTWLEHSKQYAAAAIDRFELDSTSKVVELASNDGYLLQYFVEAGIPVLGVEPAANVAAVAQANGVPTVVRFFGREAALELRGEHGADLIVGNNVLAHVPDINGVISGISRVLADDGVAIVETPYVRDLVDKLEFDTIYHEHLFYYSLTSFRSLLERHGLEVVDVERIPIHGGTLRVYVARSGATSVASSVEDLLAEERELGMSGIGYFEGFAARVTELCGKLVDLLDHLTADGARVAAYGAAAKGTVLLNAAGVDARRIEFVADKNPHKQGYSMPGVHIPVVAPEVITDRMPDYLLILAWNFADEVMRQQSDYAARGGRFIVPVPEPTIVGG